jgi:hypothetical protein
MSGTYERTFSVSVAQERAWRACTHPDELARWYFTPTGHDGDESRFDLYGTEVTVTIFEADRPHRLRYGARLGLEPGDLLVEVGGAPVFGYRELWTVARATPPGREATATWIRAGELHRGSAILGPRPRPAVIA